MRVRVVDACQRAGQGGSPTAVVDDTSSLTDAERRAVPGSAGTSHAVFISAEEHGWLLRFFTATGELPACGHGTVAALAVLAERARSTRYETVLRAGGRTFLGEATGGDGEYEAVFDPGPVELRDPTATDRAPILAALGVDALAARIASVGRPRLLVEVADRSTLADLAPDLTRLRAACDRAGLLGCYVYSTPSPDGRAAARMFAPSIGVAEDIANANSTACLAAHLAGRGSATLTVDMGDSLGRPATVIASARPGPNGALVRVGGKVADPDQLLG
ncbi:MAG TPA: PhzF family phenazine biosynthesis isomerase [Pseudonocardiaceae bacterium]|jgi:PhzF family phenazine biosynthesis protein|nr:PhzF family phenazine biosynthesis isomerase [Pseudonocardiaceae bacterium]